MDLRSPDETKRSLGFCAASRALKAARLLLVLYHYEEEQLSDLPPQGIAAITGMTMAEVEQAFALYEAKRASKEELTFKGVLWLASQSNPLQQIGVGLTPFASLPSHWNRDQIVTQYIYVLALDFGVDPREFWPVSQGPLGSGKEAEIQAQKAKGKGFGQMIAKMERAVNWDILPEGLEFAFDLRDSEDDLMRERIRQQVIANVRALWEPSMATGTGLIETDEARRLLIEAQVLPEWAGAVEDAVMESVAAKAARAGLAAGEDLVAINRAGAVMRLWPPRRYVEVAWPGGGDTGQDPSTALGAGSFSTAAKAGRPRANAGRDRLDARRRRAERKLTKALYAWFAPLAEQLAGWLAQNQGTLEAAQAEATRRLDRARRGLSSPKSAQAEQSKADLDIPIDWNAEQEQLWIAIGDLLQEIWDGALEAAKAEAQTLTLKIDWTLFDRKAANLAEQWLAPKIKDLTDSTRRMLGQAISEWIHSPDDFPTLVERVRTLVPTNPYPRVRDRAQLIAATEVTAIYAESRHTEFRAGGLRHSRWQTAADELVCPICRALGAADDGKGAVGDVSTGKYLNPDDGQYYEMPAHPGCRCWCVADTDELTDFGELSRADFGELSRAVEATANEGGD